MLENVKKAKAFIRDMRLKLPVPPPSTDYFPERYIAKPKRSAKARKVVDEMFAK